MRNEQTPYFIELVGLAGTGKSTLAAALDTRLEQVELITPPDLHAARDLPFFIGGTIAMLPTFFAIARENGWKLPSAHEMALMVMLNGWPSRLAAQRNKANTALLVDQGPISFLGMIQRLNARWRSTRGGKKWLDGVFQKWSKVIRLIILLDADNDVLVERIRSRDQEHRLKTTTYEEAVSTLEMYRKIYPNVISCLQVDGVDIKTLSYNSTKGGKEALHARAAADVERELALAKKGAVP